MSISGSFPICAETRPGPVARDLQFCLRVHQNQSPDHGEVSHLRDPKGHLLLRKTIAIS